MTSSVDVDVAPETVWRHVVAFAQLPPPQEWYFHTGIAYPVRAVIKGTGVGAVRYCMFSTGAFVEPITVWDAPRLLRFGVVSQPRPMQEWPPYANVPAPHLDDYLVSEQGQFVLTPLPGGRTRLEGTTWYRHQVWPVTYWRVYSDAIIYAIHMRVLRHVQRLSEGERRASHGPMRPHHRGTTRRLRAA